ncbi:hypothetical protein ACX80E_05650, partial [Arthrobacter sp. TMN-49]
WSLFLEEEGAMFAETAAVNADSFGFVPWAPATELPQAVLEDIFRDNPQGQTTETTPMSLVFTQK